MAGEEANELNELVVVIPLGLSAICAYTDIKSNLVLNRVTIPMVLLGIIYSALTGKIVESLLGLTIGFGIMLVGVLKGGTGAGDAKLAGALGAWMGMNILVVIVIACAIGFVWSCARLYRHRMLKTRIVLFCKGVYYRFVYGMQGAIPMLTLPDGDDVLLLPEAIPFGVCLAAAAWIVLVAVYLKV